MAHRPRVALVALGIGHGGGMERALTELVNRLADRIEFVVIAIELAPDLQSLVDWIPVRAPLRPAPLRLATFSLMASQKLTTLRVDLVHSTGAMVLNKVDLATVHHCHAGFREKVGRLAPAGQGRLRRANTSIHRLLALVLERWCYRAQRLRMLAAVSQGVARELGGHYPGVPVLVTPNGVDVRRFRRDERVRQRERLAAGLGDDDVVALFVGGDWDLKGLGIVIESLAVARAANGCHLLLWVAGRGDADRFARAAREHGVADRVSFLGFREDLEIFYQAADIFVLPSAYETFSLVAYEAAACGLPIVATDCSGIRELVGPNEAGIVVQRDAGSVADALMALAGDPALRSSMGRTGQGRVQASTWSVSAEKVLDAYHELMRTAPRGAVL